MQEKFPDGFWTDFDQAVKEAEKTESWGLAQREIDSLLTELAATQEQEEALYNAYLKQWTQAMYRMYKKS